MTVAAAVLVAAAFTRPLERVSTMDPAMAQSAYDARAVQLVYETPLSIDYVARPYRLAPGLCEMPEVSEDGLRYVFRLAPRPAPLRVFAGDMVRALERLRSKEEVSPNGWMMADVDTVRAIDDMTVEIRLKRRVRHFPWLMALAPAAVKAADGSGTGPYELVKWRKNHEMVFERRPGPDGAPYSGDGFSTVRYLVVDDLSTQWLMFLRGELDFLGDVSRDNFDAVVGKDGTLSPELERKGVRLYSMPMLEVAYVGVNMRDRVLGQNRSLRQALNCAFDFPEWAKFCNGRVAPSDGPVPPGVADRLETPFAYSFDLDRARRLMAEAGYANGIDPATGRRLTLSLAIGRPSQESRAAGELMAAFYERIGIRLELDFMTWDAFLSAVNEGRVQLYRMAWVGDYPDAQNFLQLFYGPNASPGVNHSNFANAEFDAAYERDDWRRCQEVVREECPWIFTGYNKSFTLVGPRVGNFVQTDFPYGVEQYYRLKKAK